MSDPGAAAPQGRSGGREHPGRQRSRRSVIAALIANSAVMVTKFFAALVSGSSAMLAEAFHSVADTGNQAMLLLGMHRAERPADEEHPFGHGHERFFWAFVVSISLFVIGASVSLFKGTAELVEGSEAPDPVVPLIVLALAAVFESYGLRTGWKAFQEIRGGRSLVTAWRELKQPEVLTVLAEDTSALLGIAVAATGIALAAATDNGAWDALGSIGVGLILAVSSFLLARETRGLLIGESADPEARRRIAAILDSIADVERTVELLTLHTGPEEVLVTADVQFRDGMSTDEIEDAIDAIEERVRQELPEATRIFIEPEDRRASRAGRRGGPSRGRVRRPPLRSSR